MRKWQLVVALQVLSACGGPMTMQKRAQEAERSGDWAGAMANYDYEAEHGTYEKKKEIAGPREKAATKWMQSELERAKTALSSGDPERAFGIVSSLTREAKNRKLTQLDSTELQPFAKLVVVALLPKVVAAPLAAGNPAGARREARMLLAILDAKLADEARLTIAGQLQPHVARENQLAATAKTEGRIASAYLHGALADDYTLRTRTADEQKDSREAIDKLAANFWMMNGASPCTIIAETTRKWVLEGSGAGRLSTLRWEMTACDIEPEVVTSRETRKYTKVIKGTTVAGSRGAEKVGSQRTRSADDPAADYTGNPTYTPGDYTPGGATQDHGVETEGVAIVKRTHHRWHLEGKLVAEVAGEPSTEATISHDSSVDDESYEIVGAEPGDSGTKVGPDTKKITAAREIVENAIRSHIISATRAMGDRRADALAAAAASASTPEIAEDQYIAAVRAYGRTHPSASAFLEKRLAVPADDIVALILTGATPIATSPLAFQLAIPQPKADLEAMRGTDEVVMTSLGREHSLDKNVELAAGLAQGASSTDRMGAGSGEGTFGFGLGLLYGVLVDPGMGSGVIADAAMDFEVGYAGGLAYDFSVPVSLGYRRSGVGVTLLGSVGWDKWGDSSSAGLYLNTSPYYGYGLGGSFLTAGKFDVFASYMHLGRSDMIAEDDLTITEEDRFEVRLLMYQSWYDLISITGRYSQAAGGMQDGRIFSVWFGKVAH